MKGFFEKILDSRVLERAALAIIALATLFVLFKILTNEIPHFQQALENNTAALQKIDKSTEGDACGAGALGISARSGRRLERR